MTLKIHLKSEIGTFLSADFVVLVGLTTTWFSEGMLISNICIHGFMCSAIKKSWKVSITYLPIPWWKYHDWTFNFLTMTNVYRKWNFNSYSMGRLSFRLDYEGPQGFYQGVINFANLTCQLISYVIWGSY